MSSSSSNANFSNLLGSIPGHERQPRELDDPATRILKVLLKGMVPVSDLAELTQLTPDACFEGIEKLRSRDQAEIVEVPDQGRRKFARLTTRGYAFFAA
jgi:hypothetical protein